MIIALFYLVIGILATMGFLAIDRRLGGPVSSTPVVGMMMLLLWPIMAPIFLVFMFVLFLMGELP